MDDKKWINITEHPMNFGLKDWLMRMAMVLVSNIERWWILSDGTLSIFNPSQKSLYELLQT